MKIVKKILLWLFALPIILIGLFLAWPGILFGLFVTRSDLNETEIYLAILGSVSLIMMWLFILSYYFGNVKI